MDNEYSRRRRRMPKQLMLTILEIRSLSDTAFSIKLAAGELAETAAPGQFLHIKCQESSILRRPLSICDVTDGVLTIAAEVRGEGTGWLSRRQPGETLDILGPLGRGFDLRYDNILAVGGGIGAAPMLFAARSAPARAVVLGFQTKNSVILTEEFGAACENVYITTDDGSYGEPGTVLGPTERLLKTKCYGAVLACGPRPMLRAVAALSASYGIPCQVSLEERMGCGVGACLVCACRTKKENGEQMKHVCKDGPVFDGAEVVW
jgi:dihydroorotate dehydrogenase electron transfer subunit